MPGSKELREEADSVWARLDNERQWEWELQAKVQGTALGEIVRVDNWWEARHVLDECRGK